MKMVNTGKTHICPICKEERIHIPRYPRYCCNDCVKRAKNRWGLDVKFFNTSPAGGFEAVTEVDRTTDHYCTIDGIVCHADEAHFGGIVVQTVNEN